MKNKYLMAAEREKIGALTRSGMSQKAIGERLGLSRGTVYHQQKRLGLQLPRHGPRAPVLTENQKSEVLALLKSGMGTGPIAKTLGLRQHAVRRFAETHFRRRPGERGYRWHLSDAKRAKILDEIRNRQNFALHLAWKYGVSYKLILKLAHEALRCPKFRSGHAEPLLSDYPQRHTKERVGHGR